MADLTSEEFAEAVRFRQNKEQGLTAADDETAIESIADYMMVTADTMQNPTLKASIRDIANELIQSKSVLAKGGGQELPPTEAPIPPGAIPQGQAPLPPAGF